MKDLVLYSVFILIAALVVPRLNKKQLEFFNHFIIRLLFLVAIVYYSLRDQVAALLIAIIFVSLIYNLNKYKIKKTFDITLELAHEQHKKESPDASFGEVDTSMIFKPRPDMGTNTL
jgi:chromate transport protein ChrA